MTLVMCMECGMSASDQAKICPTCGYVLIKPKRTPFGNFIKFAFIIFNIVMLILFIYGASATSDAIADYDSTVAQEKEFLRDGFQLSLSVGIWVIGDIILGILLLLTRPK